MSHPDAPVPPRDFSKTDGERAFVAVALLTAVGACYWFGLPFVQSLLVPRAPGGRTGPWVLRPILAFHFGAVAVMASVTVPVLIRSLNKTWMREDAAAGTRYDPFHGRPVKRFLFNVKGGLLLLVYAASLFFTCSRGRPSDRRALRSTCRGARCATTSGTSSGWKRFRTASGANRSRGMGRGIASTSGAAAAPR